MNRTTASILLVAGLSGLAGFLYASHLQKQRVEAARPDATAVVGQALPDLAGEPLNTSRERLSAFRGRALLLNFWATWCAPCRREMPDLLALRGELDRDRAEVVGVALDHPADVRRFVSELGIDYPILVAGDLDGTRMLRRLGNANGLLPFSVLVDADGTIRDIHLGELSRDQARALLDSVH